MPNFATLEDYAKEVHRRKTAMRRSITLATEWLAFDTKMFCVELSDGGISMAELKRRGHPYGRGSRQGRGSAPLRPINFQNRMNSAGKQRGGIPLKQNFVVMPRKIGGDIAFQLQNLSRHSKWVLAPGGTSKMRDRGFWPAVYRHLEQRNPAGVVLGAIRTALSG